MHGLGAKYKFSCCSRAPTKRGNFSLTYDWSGPGKKAIGGTQRVICHTEVARKALQSNRKIIEWCTIHATTKTLSFLHKTSYARLGNVVDLCFTRGLLLYLNKMQYLPNSSMTTIFGRYLKPMVAMALKAMKQYIRATPKQKKAPSRTKINNIGASPARNCKC